MRVVRMPCPDCGEVEVDADRVMPADISTAALPCWTYRCPSCRGETFSLRTPEPFTRTETLKFGLRLGCTDDVVGVARHEMEAGR
jgi:predicted RNA-binding Zn-ribbon protein involved in translation (DUF1610 family)